MVIRELKTGGTSESTAVSMSLCEKAIFAFFKADPNQRSHNEKKKKKRKYVYVIENLTKILSKKKCVPPLGAIVCLQMSSLILWGKGGGGGEMPSKMPRGGKRGGGGPVVTHKRFQTVVKNFSKCPP